MHAIFWPHIPIIIANTVEFSDYCESPLAQAARQLTISLAIQLIDEIT